MKILFDQIVVARPANAIGIRTFEEFELNKRSSVVFTREHNGHREFLGLQPFTADLCKFISKNPWCNGISPLEAAVALGSGDRIYVKTADGVFSYLLDDKDG